MKKISVIFGLLSISVLLLNAQPYDNSVGLRAGYSSGLAFRHFINRDFAIEAQALYNPFGFQLSALFETQFSPYPKERLQYYFGIGPHTGNWDNEFSLGAAVIAGGEFIFREAPVILGLEWKPMINIYKQFDFVIPDFALTFKVVLN
jgi:hypothetical protein